MMVKIQSHIRSDRQIAVCRTDTRAHFYTPFGVVRYARNLALPLGELSAQPTEREKHDHTKGQQPTGKRPAVTQGDDTPRTKALVSFPPQISGEDL